MGNLKIGVRLGLSFGVLCCFLIGISIFSAYNLNAVEDNVQGIVESNVTKMTQAAKMEAAVQNIFRSVALIVGVENPTVRADLQKYIQAQRDIYKAAIAILDKLETQEEGKQKIVALKEGIARLADIDDRAVNAALIHKQAEADVILSTEFLAGIKVFLSAVEDLNTYLAKRVDIRYIEIKDEVLRIEKWTRIVVILSLLLAMVMAWFISMSIVTPLRRMRLMLQDIAQGEGDLTKRLNDSSKDEIGEVSKWFNMFVEKLNGIICQISSTASQVATASNQLQGTSEQIATGAEEVAAQSATVATAGEEMAATAIDIASNCSMVAENANTAVTLTKSGFQIVTKTVEGIKQRGEQTKTNASTITSLGQRSEQIGEIVGTIEDIADQTNLLALNAAIEAARAGEHGRGFAVVADEVRTLASRTAKATKEIGAMIKAIQLETGTAIASMEREVENTIVGAAQAQELEQALTEVLSQINEVSTQIQQIATAAEEQTATTSEISNNMGQITEVVCQTSSGAHESAEAAAVLSKNADILQTLVNQFKV